MVESVLLLIRSSLSNNSLREEMKAENPFSREFHFTKWEDLGVF